MFKHQSILPLSLLAGLILGSAATIATTSNAGPPGAPGLGTAATPATAPDPEPPRVVDSRETTQQREPVATEAAVIFDLRSMQIDPNDFESLQRRTAITLPAFESKDPVQFELELLRQAVDGRASVEQHGVWIVIRGSKAGIREARRIRAAVADFVSPPVTLQCTVIQLPLSDPNSATLLAEQAIRRPAYFTRFMFAQELDRRLEELSKFQYQIDKPPPRAIKGIYKKTRETLAPLKRHLQRAEEVVFEDAIILVKEINSVGRGASIILDNEEEIRKRDLQAFQGKLSAFRKKLRQVYDPEEKK